MKEKQSSFVNFFPLHTYTLTRIIIAFNSSNSLHFLSIPRLLFSISFNGRCLKMQLLQRHSILFSTSHPGIIGLPCHTSYTWGYISKYDFQLGPFSGTTVRISSWIGVKSRPRGVIRSSLVMDMFVTLIMVTVSWMYFYPQIHQVVYNIYRFLYVSHTSIILWFLFRSNKSFAFY